VPSVVAVVDSLTAERRRTTAALARLHDVLGAVEAQPDLAATLDSIAASIGQNVRAPVAIVILRDGESLAVAARPTVPSTLTPAKIDRFTRVEVELDPESPLVARVGRTPVVVADLDDGRFAQWSTPWAQTLRGLGCRRLVVAPLRLGTDVIGPGRKTLRFLRRTRNRRRGSSSALARTTVNGRRG
jgi:transcriptional regulator with GAF, ATPase, and Fis domain